MPKKRKRRAPKFEEDDTIRSEESDLGENELYDGDEAYDKLIQGAGQQKNLDEDFMSSDEEDVNLLGQGAQDEYFGMGMMQA